MCDCQLPTKAAVTQTPENKIVENQVVKEMWTEDHRDNGAVQ